MKNITFIILLLIYCSANASDYGRFTIKTIVQESWRYIENTKDQFRKRVISIKKETGEKIVLNFRYFQKMDKKQKRFHEKFLKAQISHKNAHQYINNYLRELESIRKVIALAEERASKSWVEKQKKEEPAKKTEFTSAELYGVEIKTKKLGVILDVSYSMRTLLPKLRAEINLKFPNAYFIEIYGSQIHTYFHADSIGYYAKPEEGDNPFEKKWHKQSIPQQNVYSYTAGREQSNLAAMLALAKLKQVDSIYWFSDMKDVGRMVTDQGVTNLAAILKTYNVKIYAHTVGLEPTHKLRKVLNTYGKVIRKKTR
jgi:hypothetical protein